MALLFRAERKRKPMTDTFIFPATLEDDPESGETIASFRDVPATHTAAPNTATSAQGDHMIELRAAAMGALEGGVARMITDREPLPTPSVPQPGDLLVPLRLRMAAKLALHRVCRERGIGPAELARRLGCGLREAQRLLDTTHQTRIDRLADAVQRLGGPIPTLAALTAETTAHHA